MSSICCEERKDVFRQILVVVVSDTCILGILSRSCCRYYIHVCLFSRFLGLPPQEYFSRPALGCSLRPRSNRCCLPTLSTYFRGIPFYVDIALVSCESVSAACTDTCDWLARNVSVGVTLHIGPPFHISNIHMSLHFHAILQHLYRFLTTHNS